MQRHTNSQLDYQFSIHITLKPQFRQGNVAVKSSKAPTGIAQQKQLLGDSVKVWK